MADCWSGCRCITIYNRCRLPSLVTSSSPFNLLLYFLSFYYRIIEHRERVSAYVRSIRNWCTQSVCGYAAPSFPILNTTNIHNNRALFFPFLSYA